MSRIHRPAKALAAALAFGAVALAGSLAPTPAQAGKCGGLNQRTCTVFERPGKPCDGNLRMTSPVGGKCVRRAAKPKPKPRACGGRNQAACTVLQRPGRPCDNGLILTKAIGGRCIAKTFDQDKVLRSASRQLEALRAVTACMGQRDRKASFKRFVDQRATAAATRLVETQCLTPQRRADLRRPVSDGGGGTKTFNTLTIGIGAGVQVIGSVAVDSGIAIDLNGKRKARFYTNAALGAGVGIGIGADVIGGLSKDVLPSTKTVYDGTSYTTSGKIVAGGAVAINFDGFRDRRMNAVLLPGNFDGFAFALGVGAGGSILSGAHEKTTIW